MPHWCVGKAPLSQWCEAAFEWQGAAEFQARQVKCTDFVWSWTALQLSRKAPATPRPKPWLCWDKLSFNSKGVACAWTWAGVVICFNTAVAPNWHQSIWRKGYLLFLGMELVLQMRPDNTISYRDEGFMCYKVLSPASTKVLHQLACPLVSGAGTRCECYKNSLMDSLFSYVGHLASLEFKCVFVLNQPTWTLSFKFHLSLFPSWKRCTGRTTLARRMAQQEQILKMKYLVLRRWCSHSRRLGSLSWISSSLVM